MKKIITLALALIMVLSLLAACGGSKAEPPATSAPPSAAPSSVAPPPSSAPPPSPPSSAPPPSQAPPSTPPPSPSETPKVSPPSPSPTGGNSTKVAEQFFKAFSDGTYHMKASMKMDDVETILDAYIKGGKVAMFMEIEGQKVRMLFADEKVYLVMDEQKMVMVMSLDLFPMGDISEDVAFDTSKMKYLGSGKAEFNGKNLAYDEYELDEGGKMMMFVDGKNIAGIRNVIDGQNMDIVILEFDSKVSDDVFKIPDDYQKIEM